MEDKKMLHNEELDKVSGGNAPEIVQGGDMSYTFQYLVCPDCGLEVASDWHTPLNVKTVWLGGTANACDLYCYRCGHRVGSGYFAGEKDW